MESDVTVDSEWSKVQLRLARNPAFTALATQEERQACFDDYQAELRASFCLASDDHFKAVHGGATVPHHCSLRDRPGDSPACLKHSAGCWGSKLRACSTELSALGHRHEAMHPDGSALHGPVREGARWSICRVHSGAHSEAVCSSF